MNQYVIIALGWAIGQFGYAAVSVYVLQRNKDLSYWKAVQLYLSSEIGNFVIAFAGLLLIMFIANDFLDSEITAKDLRNKEVLTLKEKVVLYQRSASVGIGAFIQHLLFIAFKKGKKKIEQYEQQVNITGNP
jgi:hypothetical protein